MTEDGKTSLHCTSAIKVETTLIESSNLVMADESEQSAKTADRTVEESNLVKSPDVPSELSTPLGPSLVNKATVAKDATKLIVGGNGSSGKRINSACPALATSPPNFLTVPTASSVAPSSDHVVVKSEPQDDIKDYVETTMNELLGWYGLPKMDKCDTPHVTLDTYPSRVTTAEPPPMITGMSSQKRKSLAPRSSPAWDSMGEDCKIPTVASASTSITNKNNCKPTANDTNNNSNSCSGKTDGDDELDDDDDDDIGVDDKDEFLGSDDDMVDELDDSPSIRSDMSPLGGVSENERGTSIVCSWCQKQGTKHFTLDTPTGEKSFCSELCFTQCRRASFKKKKVCDWCKHVRHTVNFVDFQEGDVQLQFCSEKCLNQYKMNIFCTEARQHLQHIQNIVSDEDKTGEGKQGELLITPQLWLYGNSHESNDSVKEEVTSVKNDKVIERKRERRGIYSKADEDEEEPGELRESIHNGSSRLTHSDDSSCSMDDRVGLNAVPLGLHHPHSDVIQSPPVHPMLKTEDLHHNGGETRPRKDLGKSKKTADQKARSLMSDHSKETLGVHQFRKEKHLYLQQNIADSTSSNIAGLPGSIESQTSQSLLPKWSSSQLLAMMPPHLNSGLSLGAVSYASNPLLYSSLFGTSHLTSHTEKEHQVKSRHESRRELLRDRDRFTDTSDRKKSITVPLSPSTSHSSTDTPGPTTTSGSMGIHSHHAVHPHVLSDLARHFPHNHLLLGDATTTNPLSHYFTNPSLAGLIPFPLPINHPHNPPRTVLPTPAVHNTPSTATTQPQIPPPQPSIQYPGLPPVTVMVPYPVAVPIPIPLPIPIPISPEKLSAYFREKSEAERPVKKPTSFPYNRSRSPDDIRPRAASANHVVNPLSALSPRPTSKCSSLGGLPLGSTPSLTESPEPGLVMLTGRESADSIMTLRREIGRSQLRVSSTSPCSSSNIKIMMSPGIGPYTVSRGVSQDSPRNEDEAMDLSKMSSRSESPRRSTDSSEKENKSAIKRGALSDTDVCTSRDIKVPRIHIISEPPDPPLSQPPPSVPLSQPLEQSTYSSRRSRILDAPSVPKKSRSPSPERRYIRTVPRDMVEAARRRGLRARVRSK